MSHAVAAAVYAEIPMSIEIFSLKSTVISYYCNPNVPHYSPTLLHWLAAISRECKYE